MMKKLIDIGNKKIEISFHGSGTPIVVIETGMGGSWYEWYKVINEISKRTTVIAYHRAGYGESTLAKEYRTTKQIAEDLNMLLEKVGIKSPIILVGHSFGGLCVQHFANLFSEKVLGMVLVDSNSADEYKMEELINKLPSFSRNFPKKDIIEKWREISLKSEEDLQILNSPKLFPEQMEFEDNIQKSILKFQINPNMYSVMASELEFMVKSGQDIKKCFKKLDISLNVLGRDSNLAVEWSINMGIPKDEAVKYETLWHNLIKEEAKISTKGHFIEVIGSKHSIYRTNPEAVIEAINDVIDKSYHMIN